MAKTKEKVNTVWIRNLTGYNKKYITRDAGGEAKVEVTLPTLIQTPQGAVISVNVKAVTEDVYNALYARCPIFKSDILSRQLIKTDTQPADAVSDGSKIAQQAEEIALLKEQLKTASDATNLEELSDVKAKNEALEAELAAVKAQLSGAALENKDGAGK